MPRGWRSRGAISGWETGCQEEFSERVTLGAEGWTGRVGSGLGSPLTISVGARSYLMVSSANLDYPRA